jgi:iron complex outermembrane receptor protein
MLHHYFRAGFPCAGLIKFHCYSLAACILAPFAAHAQTLDEIIVTAQKREQSLQDVSISVSAWSGEAIRDLGLEQSWEIARFTPGVHVASTSGGQDMQFTIRGVTQTDFNDSIEPPNAVYVDEGYMATVQGNRFGMFDLDRVEILRGPQGTLFGRNATGGLVHYITRKPTEELEGYVDGLVGSEGQTRIEAAIGGPLSDTLSGRLSGMYNQHDEVITNVFPDSNVINPLTGQPFIPSTAGQDDYWNDDSWGIRGQLLWEPNEDLELLISGFAWSEDVATNGSYEQGATTAIIDAQGRHVNTIFAKDDPQSCEAISAESGACLPIDFVDGTFGNTVRPVQGGDLFGFTDPGGGGDQRVSADHSIDDFNTYDQFGFTAKLTWDIGFATLTSVTHYMDYEKRQSLDTDLAPEPQSVVMNENESDTISQELRLDGEGDNFRWVAGFYYLGYDNSNVIGFGFPPDSPITILLPGLDPSFTGPFESDSFVEWNRDSYSLFGQIDYNLTDRLTLVVGARVVQEESDYEFAQFFFPSSSDERVEANQDPIPSFLQYPPFSDDTDDTLWAGRLMLEYRLGDNVLLYGGANRGTKAGGFNGKLNDFTPPLDPSDIPYDEEVLWAYEAGFKSTIWNGTTRVNGSAYYYDYQDYQAFVFVGSSGFVRNADAETFGLELEVASRPIEPLDLSFSLSWIDAEVQNLEIATDVLRDVEPAHTPEWQVAAIGRYTWSDVLFGGDVAFQIAATYTDSRFHNIRNFDAQEMEDYTLVDARLAWMSADGRWDVSVFGNNIFDEEYKITGFDLATFCGCNEEAWGKPSWWGVQARVNF